MPQLDAAASLLVLHLDSYIVFVIDESFFLSRVSCVCTPSLFRPKALTFVSWFWILFLGLAFLRLSALH